MPSKPLDFSLWARRGAVLSCSLPLPPEGRTADSSLGLQELGRGPEPSPGLFPLPLLPEFSPPMGRQPAGSRVSPRTPVAEGSGETTPTPGLSSSDSLPPCAGPHCLLAATGFLPHAPSACLISACLSLGNFPAPSAAPWLPMSPTPAAQRAGVGSREAFCPWGPASCEPLASRAASPSGAGASSSLPRGRWTGAPWPRGHGRPLAHRVLALARCRHQRRTHDPEQARGGVQL